MFMLLYVMTCLLVGWLATHRGHSLLLYTILSLVITPVITLLILLFLVPRRTELTARTAEVTCPRCSHALKHIKSIEFCSHCGEPV
jgi:hypothetical protein